MENENKSSEEKKGVQATSVALGAQSSSNETKVKEYESMFNLLYKQKDYQKLSALIEELNQLHIADGLVKTWQEKVKKKQLPGFLGSLFGRKKAMSQVAAQAQKKDEPELVKGTEATNAAPKPVVVPVVAPTSNGTIPPKKDVLAPVVAPKPMAEKPATTIPAVSASKDAAPKKPVIADSGLTFEMRPPEAPKKEVVQGASITPVVSKTSTPAAPSLLQAAPAAPKIPVVSASDSKGMPEAPRVSSPAPENKPVVTPSAPVQSPVVPAVVKAASDSVVPKKLSEGNTFTKMFGRGRAGEKTGSVIDQIVASSEKKKEDAKSAPLQTKTERQINRLASFAKVFANFTAIFVVLTAAFLYVEFIDQNNRVLGVFGVDQNTGSKLHQAAETLSEKQQEEVVLERQIQEYMGGYNDESLNTLQMLIDGRINWPDIISKITEVTNSVYELNDFFQYVQYDNYAFDAERQTIRISGTLSDPQGRNLTKLVELEDAFMSFPHDPNNPNDETLPYFQDFKELTSLRKTYDEKTGRYTSDFQLSFALTQDSTDSN